MKVMKTTFGRRLKQLRKEKRMTQQQLGDRLRLARNTIAMYETGIREPSFRTVQHIADIMGTSVDYLLGRTNELNGTSETGSDPETRAIMRALKGRTKEQQEAVMAFIKYLDEQDKREAKKARNRGEKPQNDAVGPANGQHDPPRAR